MKDLEFLYAINDIDDEFITEAADDERLKEAFCAEWGEEDKGVETDSDTEEAPQQKSTKRTHKVSFKKIMLVAVISALLFAVATTVSAYVFEFNIKEELVEFFDDHIRLHLDKVDSTADSYSLLGTDLAKELEENGISPVTLPAALLTEEWIIKEIAYQHGESFTAANIEFVKDDLLMALHIVEYTHIEQLASSNIHNAKKGTLQNINGIDVFVFDLSIEPYAKWVNGLTAYSIMTNCDYETLLEISKTIQ